VDNVIVDERPDFLFQHWIIAINRQSLMSGRSFTLLVTHRAFCPFLTHVSALCLGFASEYRRRLNEKIMKSKLLMSIAGLVVMAVAFFTTLWLTAPTPAELLAKHVMPDDASVRAAATLEGLSESPDLKGAIDSANRKDASTVTLSGWAVDLGRLRVTALVLVDGKSVMNARTSGPRPDIVKAYPATSGLDMQFKGDALCSKGTTPRLVIVSEDKRFSLGFSAATCP